MNGVRGRMGQRHREKRKVTKRLARRFGMRETELGELKHHLSKAEARRRFVATRTAFEQEIMQVACARAIADLQEEEDARCFAKLEELANTATVNQ